MNPLETTMRSCPEDICDGTGMMYNAELEQEEPCVCVRDPWAVEPKNYD